jgi:subtilisin family serine protease
MFGTVDQAGLSTLRTDARVASVTAAPQMGLIRPKRAYAVKMTEARTWGIEELGIPALWKQGLRGKGVLVAHLDTGVDGKHPVLKGAISAFAEFDFFGQLIKPTPKPHDTQGHGTHTAATIVGRLAQGKSVGVAPEATLVSAIVIEGGQVVARVLGGLDWALDQGVSVLSMSLGLPGSWDDFLPIVRILRTRNVLPVIAVGNEGPGTSRAPGNYPEALSVGAIDRTGTVVDFSSSQRFKRKRESVVPDLVAPGKDVISAAAGGGFVAADGTSMATPHIAGLAALLREAKPAATAAEVERAIFSSCKRGPGISEERGNRGFPNAERALKALKA